ncbi:Alpha/Beta hydrolase protein [Aspergillus keveii]|uniref:Carboxylic ester hydrolase n=1 Tax=Aspergillus keveii TaxID=714993 RepID=A0ABR4G3P7_9EURO
MAGSRCLVLLTLCALFMASAHASELCVQTSTGQICGAYVDSIRSVRGFLGIPYAEAPVGDLRWAPPKARKSSQVDATSFGASCPQGRNNAPNISEDCLSLNIWTPSSKRLSRPAAVMLYIHGGSYTMGAGSENNLNGLNIVRDHEGVIVVTINYRLGVFGFPNAPGIPDGKQNVGLLDQRLAVQWVSSNIRRFGGDPERIMLFGESAGAASVDLYTYAYHAAPLVHAAVLQSGTTNLLLANDPSYQSWSSLANSVSCNPADLVCMRRVSVDEILAGLGSNASAFVPVVDETVVFSNYTERAGQGKMAKIPMLIGSNSDELPGVPLITHTVFTCPARQAAEYRVENNLPVWVYMYHGNWTGIGAFHASDVPMIFGTYGSPAPGQAQASKYMQSAWVSFAQNPYSLETMYHWPFYKDGKMVDLAPGNRRLPDFTSTAWIGLVCGGMPISRSSIALGV